jgi:hypothetical protein
VTAPPVFPIIVGCGRSGTTLVRSVLDANPVIAVPPESFFIIDLAKHRDGPFDASAFVDDLLAHDRFAMWPCDHEKVRRAVLLDPPRDFAGAIRRVFAAYAESQGKLRYGDKTPRYVKHLPALAALLPEARFIHVVRDGRDVAPGIVKMRWGPDNLRAAAAYWQHHVELGRRAGRALDPECYLEVSYEQLVVDPQPVIERMCAFVDIPFDDAMLHPEARFDQVIAGVDEPSTHTGLQRPIGVVRDWRRDLTAREVALVEALVGDTLRAAGYELSDDRRVRARASWLRATFMARRTARRVVRPSRGSAGSRQQRADG